MTKKRKLSTDELRAWKKVTRSVRAISSDRRPFEIDLSDDGPAKPTENTEERKKRVIQPSLKPKIENRTGLADRRNEKKIRRGRTDTYLRLDLHGFTQDEAFQRLCGFVAQCRSMGERSALVITGKGRGGTGVLRARFIDWLDAPEIRKHVSGFAPAHQKHGGEGAFYIFFRASRS